MKRKGAQMLVHVVAEETAVAPSALEVAVKALQEAGIEGSGEDIISLLKLNGGGKGAGGSTGTFAIAR